MGGALQHPISMRVLQLVLFVHTDLHPHAMEVRGQGEGDRALLPPCRLQELNAGQPSGLSIGTLPSEPCHWPKTPVF